MKIRVYLGMDKLYHNCGGWGLVFLRIRDRFKQIKRSMIFRRENPRGMCTANHLKPFITKKTIDRN